MRYMARIVVMLNYLMRVTADISIVILSELLIRKVSDAEKPFVKHIEFKED